MYQDYSVNACNEYLIKNAALLSTDPKFRSIVSERMSSEYDGHKFVDAHGYDQLNEENNDKIEIKFTCCIQKGTNLRVSSLKSKRNKCDYFKLIDGINNRISVIPHDAFFEVFDLTNADEFRWCAYYGNRPNTDRKIKPIETELFLKYEVPNVK